MQSESLILLGPSARKRTTKPGNPPAQQRSSEYRILSFCIPGPSTQPLLLDFWLLIPASSAFPASVLLKRVNKGLPTALALRLLARIISHPPLSSSDLSKADLREPQLTWCQTQGGMTAIIGLSLNEGQGLRKEAKRNKSEAIQTKALFKTNLPITATTIY